MPVWRRKRVALTQPSNELLLSSNQPNRKQVFYLVQTGEIFEDYESYSSRLSFYRAKQFQCEVTGKGGLDYFEALQSELHEGKTLHERFPEALKVQVLRAVQWQIVGRLDHLVESVFERFKCRFFRDEKVLLDLQGEKYWARVSEVFPPKGQSNDDAPHRVGCNLSIALKDSVEQDNPSEYFYKVQIQEEGTAHSSGSTDASKSNADATKWSGSVMDVQCTTMSRDRLTFSKSLLRRFLRDNIDREAAVASPWTVKPHIASKHGLDTEMSEQIKIGVESVRKIEIEKRKKVWEEKEGPPTKKQKKAANDEKGKSRRKEEEEHTRVAAEQVLLEKEAAAAALEAKKKKQLKYPAEDLDVVPSERSKKHTQKIRPCPKRDVPFGENFEAFLMSWSYLQVFGVPLHLSPFTLDEFEEAVLYNSEEPCSLMAEIHACLVYNIRQVPGQRNIAISSLYEHSQDLAQSGQEDEDLIPIDQLIEATRERGSNWDRSPLRNTSAGEVWQEAVIGLLKEHATVDAFPRLRQVLTCLIFPETTDVAPELVEDESPTIIYNRLLPLDKIALIAFLCNCSISSKAVRGYMESCEEQLTQLRKEKTELNRERKRCVEQMTELTEQKAPAQENGDDETKADGDKTRGSAATGNASENDDDKSSGSEESEQHSGNNDSPVPPFQIGSRATQRQLEREKSARDKAALAEYRRLDEELNKTDRRIEGIDLEFRKLLGAARARPSGKDRFFTRIWWLDGLGGGSLVSSSGATCYGTGRVFIQGPSEIDWELMQRREDEEGDVMVRMREDLGDVGVMDIGEWGYYDEPEVLEEFLSWLNNKGKRELQLKNAMLPWKLHMVNGMRKRVADVANSRDLSSSQDHRRSHRQAGGSNKDHSNGTDSFLTWVNRRASAPSAHA